MIVLWVLLGVALLWVELHHWAFYALFVAVGALAAAVVALVAPGAIALQAGTAVGVAAVGVVAVRPYVSRIVDAHRQGDAVARGVHGGLVGEEVLTLDAVGDVHRAGHVRLAGERWLAVSASGDVIAPATPAMVTAVRGTTLVVLPLKDLEQGGET